MTRDTSTPSPPAASVFLVETPLQLLNAIEARHYFCLEQAHLRILTSPPFPRAAFTPLLEDGDWASTEYAPIRVTRPDLHSEESVRRSLFSNLAEYRSYLDQAYRRSLLNRWARALRRVDSLFLGGYMQPYMKHFANVLPHRCLVALDDGTDTLRVNQRRLHPEPTTSGAGIGRVKVFAHRTLHDWNIREPESVTFFSAFDLRTHPSDHLIKNEYSYVRTRALGTASSRDVLFLGQPLVEDGYIRFDAYVRHLKSALAFLRATDVAYAPHPRESSENVAILARETGVSVAPSDLPIELHLALRSGTPKRLASFFCSALDNSRIIFGPGLAITAFRLPSADLLTAHAFVDEIYRYFETHTSESFRVVCLPAQDAPLLSRLSHAVASSATSAHRTSTVARPMVSVIIPTYNASQYLEPTLDSVLSQADVSMEVIVVDDCSTDDTPGLMRRYAERVKYIRLEKNYGGPARPRNVGVQSATGECIALLDGDDVMFPGKLAEQYAFLACHTDIPFVFTNFCNFSDERPHQEDFLSTHLLFHRMPKEHLGKEHYRIRRTEAFETLLGDNFIGTSGVVFRAPLASAIGLFDETLKNSDDLDWWFRLTKVHDIGYINKVCHMRRVHPANISSRPSALYARLEVYTRRRRDVASKRARKNLHESLADNYFGLGYQQRLAGRRLRPVVSYGLSWYYSKWRIHLVRSMLAALLQIRPRSERKSCGV